MPNYIETRIHICPKQCKAQNNAKRNNELENIFLERRKIFNWLREKKATRFMLQEVNCIEKEIICGKQNGVSKCRFSLLWKP